MSGKAGSMTPIIIVVALLVVGLLLFSKRPDFSPRNPFVADNGLRAAYADRENRTFDVFGQPGSAGPAYFCAAAEFAIRGFDASKKDSIEVIAPETESAVKPGGKSVRFRIVAQEDAKALAPSGVTVRIDQTGESRTVAFAQQLCR